jgi:hypothetical protein
MTTFVTTVIAMYTLPQVDGQTDVVVTVQYDVRGTDGVYTANIGLSEQYTIAQGSSFTPYADLTEAQVIAWIPESALASAQACVQGQIDSMINPPVSPTAQALPWSA